MNVWEKNGRSWRKARKRAVSPIIATILLVAITVVLAAVLYVLISGLTHGPGNTPIGSAFAAGNAQAAATPAGNTGTGTCAAATTTLAAAVKPSEWTYTMTIESSTVSFGSLGLSVKAPGGAFLAGAAGGFYFTNAAGNVVACGLVAAGWSVTALTYPTAQGATASTPITTLFTLVIDTGSNAASNPWGGQGNAFVGLGQGSYSGTTSAASLP